MKGFSKIVAISLFGIVLNGSAQAATLVTPDPGAQNKLMYCTAVNTRKTPITVTIELYDNFNFVMNSITKTLQPDQAASLGPSQWGGYCKFTAPSKHSIVGMALVDDSLNHHYAGGLLAE